MKRNMKNWLMILLRSIIMINSQIKEYATVLLELDFDREQVVMIFDSLSKVLDNKELYPSIVSKIFKEAPPWSCTNCN